MLEHDQPRFRNQGLGKNKIEFRVRVHLIELENMNLELEKILYQTTKKKKTSQSMDLEFLKNLQKLLQLQIKEES